MKTSISHPKPVVSLTGPTGAFLIELLIWNGSPFKDHWAYFVQSHADPHIGVKIDATGNVRSGFEFEIKRSENLQTTDDILSTRDPLQWVDAEYFDEKATLNDGKYQIDHSPVCPFESSVYQIKAPGKILNTVSDGIKQARKVVQRDCHAWIVESADQLGRDNILSHGIVAYLHAIKQ